MSSFQPNFSYDSFSIEAFNRSLDRLGYQRSDRYHMTIAENELLSISLSSLRFQYREFSEQLNRRIIKIGNLNQSIATTPIPSSGVDWENPYKMNYEGELDITFLADADGSLFRVFQNWLNLIFDRGGFYEYRTSYATTATIFAYDTTGSEKYQFNVNELYPKTISTAEFSADTSLQELTVNFSYKDFLVVKSVAPPRTQAPAESGIDFPDLAGPGDGTAFA